ncbi:peptidase M15 [Algoriphagus kandeliae]|uniref:D-alanyl-D-alanine dipeptidase n=1 Tax=Algoriphagus kandeliae TaxID=2562278 RepID=A0A4Y9QLF3_9BACT|nr:M15 family metallopeptidase [Algoriphagus kandeliae]TFV93531.1 peptidase M15 [Algoriphagus kandeliae]
MRYLNLILLSIIWSCSAPKSDQEVFSEQQKENLAPLSEAPQESIPALEQTLIDQGLVNLEEVIPGIRVELKYSTTDNFFGQDVYGDLTHAYLQPEVAQQLKSAQESLREEYPNLTLLVYDGVRPLSVQQILWDNLDKPDSIKPLYVADPKKGSLHNYGVAVDLTIYDTQADSTLDMGTGYDFFGYAAYPDREVQMLEEGVLTEFQIKNREILRKVMTQAGFTGIGSEWWHFNAYSRKGAGEKFKIIQ